MVETNCNNDVPIPEPAEIPVLDGAFYRSSMALRQVCSPKAHMESTT